MRAKMMFKVPQENSTEASKSFENDLKMKSVDIHKTIEKSMKIVGFSSSESQLGAQICIEKVLGIRFCGSGGLWDTERRPGELQGGLQELVSERIMSCGEVKIEEKPLGKNSGHQILRLGRSLGHREATRRASRRYPRVPKSRSIELAE